MTDARDGDPGGKLPSGLELPRCDDRLCTGCGICVAVCPTDCMAMQGPLPWLPRPADCIRCALCVLVCPAAALEMAATA